MLEWGFIRSKVARRILVLFVISALIPMALTAALSLFQVSTVLTNQRQVQLLHISKNYGMAVLERLQLVQARLADIQALLRYQNSIDTLNANWHTQFDAIALLDENGTANPLLNTITVPIQLSSSAKPQIITHSTADERHQVFISLPSTSENTDQGVLLAQLNLHFLWGSPDLLPYMTNICVLSPDLMPLFCSRTPNTLFTQHDISGHSGQISWQQEDDTYLAAYRELYLQNQFDYSAWKIVAFQPQSHALAAVDAFNRLFPLIILSAILLVLFLSIGQIRNSLTPLEKLTESTRQFAKRRSVTKVDIDSNDEFGDLAHAFNAMSARISRQFTTLATLSQVDRLILTNPDFEGIVAILFKHIPAIVPCDCVAILLAKHDSATMFQAYSQNYNEISAPQPTSVLLTKAEQAPLLADSQPIMTTLETDCPYLTALYQYGAKFCYVLPISQKQRLVGMVVLGYHVQPTLTQEDEVQARDLTDRIAVALAAWEREQKLYHQAHYDVLTGLPNRTFLLELLEREILHSQHRGNLLALLFIDLDRFKNINDSMGHAAGDQLLEQAAARLKYCAGGTDTVARLGGDEFNILLTELAHPKNAGQAADKVLQVLSQPFTIYGQEYFVGASIGIAMCPDDGTTSAELMRNADTAMYRAKHGGRGHYVFFKEAMNDEVVARTQLESDLHHALQHDELTLNYQPQLDVKSNIITSAEVLLRWHHPERGWIAPDVFINLAEDINLINAIGEWVIRNACRQLRAWQSQQLPIEKLAINISSKQLKQRDFATTVALILAEEDIEPKNIELEITESLFLQQDNQITATLDVFHEIGISLALDDFGTGYSSLIYLNQFPIDTIKIDRAFITDVPTDHNATALVTSIMNLASNLHKDIVVEGVETKVQMDFVCANSASYVQGYYLSRPLNRDDFKAFVKHYNAAVDSVLST